MSDGVRRQHRNHETRLRAVRFCQELCGPGTSSSVSVARLDDMLSRAFRFRFEPLQDSQTIVKQASGLLKRLPTRALELIDTPTSAESIPRGYRAASLIGSTSNEIGLWSQLRVTNFMSNIVLKTALSTVMEVHSQSPLNMIDIIATLLEIVSELAPATSGIKKS